MQSSNASRGNQQRFKRQLAIAISLQRRLHAYRDSGLGDGLRQCVLLRGHGLDVDTGVANRDVSMCAVCEYTRTYTSQERAMAGMWSFGAFW